MFQIDSFSRVPVYEQIPSVRSLSVSLSINPNTIQKAYSELDRNGIIYSVPGRGCFITKDAREILSDKKKGKLTGLRELLKELKLAGLSKAKIIETVDEIYSEKEDAKT